MKDPEPDTSKKRPGETAAQFKSRRIGEGIERAKSKREGLLAEKWTTYPASPGGSSAGSPLTLRSSGKGTKTTPLPTPKCSRQDALTPEDHDSNAASWVTGLDESQPLKEGENDLLRAENVRLQLELNEYIRCDKKLLAESQTPDESEYDQLRAEIDRLRADLKEYKQREDKLKD